MKTGFFSACKHSWIVHLIPADSLSMDSDQDLKLNVSSEWAQDTMDNQKKITDPFIVANYKLTGVFFLLHTYLLSVKIDFFSCKIQDNGKK